jgi:hypothetical protein
VETATTTGDGDDTMDDFPSLQRPPRLVRCRVCGEHCSTSNVGLRASVTPLLFDDA